VRQAALWIVGAELAAISRCDCLRGLGSFYRVDSNDKAKCGLDWQLRHPSWRQGFAEGLG
jgi:hypothetical protein